MPGISDLTMQTTQFALDGLAARSSARANNIANVTTPGYQASSVTFESALASALDKGTTPDASGISNFVEQGTPNAQGNTVSLQAEMTQGMKDSLTYESMVNGFNYKVGILHAAIGSQA
jgi:flagellar basal-body rod protein FlgB